MGASSTPLQYVIVDFLDVLLLNQIYLTTMYHSTIPLRFIWSVCSGNYG